MKDCIIALLALLILNWVLLFMTKEFLITDKVAETAITGNYDESHIAHWRHIQSLFNIYSYIGMPIRVISHLLFISFFMYAALAIANGKISLKALVHVLTLALFVYSLPIFLRLVWFGLFNVNASFTEMIEFKPLNFAYWQGGYAGMDYKAKAFFMSFELTDVLFVVLASILITKRVYSKPLYVSMGVLLGTAVLVALNYAYYAL